MHITNLRIKNFRAIRELDLRNLSQLVIVAGPNGCGKSCIFDALRLLKSLYGGYQQNEYLQWFGEFQIDVNIPQRNFSEIFRDKGSPVEISASMRLAPAEISYIRDNSEQLCEMLAWNELLQSPGDGEPTAQTLAMQHPNMIGAVADLVNQKRPQLLAALDLDDHELAIRIQDPGSLIEVVPSIVANIVFRTYSPSNLGILDYYGATRSYAREGVGGVQLNLDAMQAQRKNLALYNAQAKYTNVKTELTSSYVGGLIRDAAGANSGDTEKLDETLIELFRTFFPNKTYLGVQPQQDGNLVFPVQLSTGERHDLNELSSGEKEVLYGYLRLRNQTPRHSTILLDEPELHLNPGLLRGFPQFYFKHLIQPTGNQIWMVTHSDALLRQAVGDDRFSVFHMISVTPDTPLGNQAVPIVKDELQGALLDLVGDLAAYRPASRVVVLEGGGDTEFDVRVVGQLFPSVRDSANLISGGGKGRVAELYRVLSATAAQTGIANRFFAITDRDSGNASEVLPGGHVFSWDVYHIENYLLDIKYVKRAYDAVTAESARMTTGEVESALRTCAQDLIEGLVLGRLRDRIDKALYGCIRIGANSSSTQTPADDLLPSVVGSIARLKSQFALVSDATRLKSWEDEIRSALEDELAEGSWAQNFPGREILKGFARNHLSGLMQYEGLVNSILSAMVADSHQPAGMKVVLDAAMST